MAERKEALGNVMALVALGFVVKPALDKLVQYATDNEKARTQPRGPLGPLTHLYEALEGKKDIGMTLSNIFTFSPSIKGIEAVTTNRDFAGRRIVEPGSPWYKKLGQAVEHGAGLLVSPYATFGPTVQPGTSRGAPLHELGSQLLDVKVPTPRQIAGEQYGMRKNLQDARSRARHPRGLLEYGLEQLGR